MHQIFFIFYHQKAFTIAHHTVLQTPGFNLMYSTQKFQTRSRDMWREAFELRTGNQQAAKRLARLVINQQRLHKRDTIADFWSRRLHDMQLRDDPVESGYGGAQPAPPQRQDYGAPKQVSLGV
jgi:hypothetical protein